jgi:hypothetical protein
MGTLHKDVFTFMAIFGRILLRMRNVLDKICIQRKYFCPVTFFPPENRAVYENMSKNMLEAREVTNDTRWRTRFSCWISKTTYAHAYAHTPTLQGTHPHTHTQKCVIFSAFPRQQWFRKSASMLRSTYIACLVYLRSVLISDSEKMLK